MGIYEDAGRLTKALKILSKVPHGATREEIEQVVIWLAAMTVSDRNVFSLYAGVKNPPSDETWDLVCKMAAGRKTRDEVLAMHPDVRPRAGTDASPTDAAGLDKTRSEEAAPDLDAVSRSAAAAVVWEKLTPDSRALFLALADDADNWSGTPLITVTPERRGNLTQLKRAKVLKTFETDGNAFARFTDLGVSVAAAQGRVLS